MKRTQKPVIAITSGDPNGIGPEVALKCALDPRVIRICSPVLVGPVEVFEFYSKRLHLPAQFPIVADPNVHVRRNTIPVYSTGSDTRCHVRPGTLSTSAGRHAANALRLASGLAIRKEVDAVVTGPVNKKALHRAGLPFDGQTEFLQHLTHSRHVAMMLISNTMRVGLATIHVPINQVALRLTRQRLQTIVNVVNTSLKLDWKIRNPRLAVLGLNPHAGEQGDIGLEERTIISPAIQALKRRRLLVEGPFPADSFFGKYRKGRFDAVIAMYHDQGLIPLKMSSFGGAVNMSAGLPIVRTSPDHGTAFDIAGKGIANPESMIAAIKMAVMIANNRKNSRG